MLCSSLFLDGYLPTDKSGDWIYQLGDVLSLLMVLQILYSVYGAHKASYQFEADTLDLRNLIMGAVVLAVLIHPDMNSWTPFDVLWTTHLYIDAVAMVPVTRWVVGEFVNVSALNQAQLASSSFGGFLRGADRFDARFFNISGSKM